MAGGVRGGATLAASFQTGNVTSQPRSSEAGNFLTAISAGAPDLSTLNSLEPDVRTFGQVYITRDGGDHLAIPTITEYHLVVKPPAKFGSEIGTIGASSLRVDSSRWLVPFFLNATKTGTFYMAQGNPLRLLRRYPSAHVPVVLAGAAVTMMRYNLPTWAVAVWLLMRALDGCGMLSVWLIEQLGAPAGKFAFTISMMYMVMIGLTLFRMGFFMIVSTARITCIQKVWSQGVPAEFSATDEVSSVTRIPTECSTILGSASQGSPLPSALKWSLSDQSLPIIVVSDTSSVDSIISSSGGSLSSIKRVCQAHLLRYDKADGPAVATKPCTRKLAKTLPLLNVDTLLQGGVRAERSNAPVMINLRKQHR